jgi:hypothetical protein
MVVALLDLRDCGSGLKTLPDAPAQQREHAALGTDNSSKRWRKTLSQQINKIQAPQEQHRNGNSCITHTRNCSSANLQRALLYGKLLTRLVHALQKHGPQSW